MKIYIIDSGGTPPGDDKKEFLTTFDDSFAQRVIAHLKDEPTFCSGCGKQCIRCRNDYDLDYSSELAGILKLPSSLKYYEDNPQRFLPQEVSPFDVLLPINIHEDVLLALPEWMKKSQGKAIIVPIEDPDWVSRWVREKMIGICKDLSVEIAFPKPFCSLEEDKSHPYINQFTSHFRIGKPKLQFEVEGNTIRRAKVLRSAPCGNTYFVAYNISGAEVDKDLKQKVAKYWHSYPCVASMKFDPELGDTILHKGGYNNYDALDVALNELKGT